MQAEWFPQIVKDAITHFGDLMVANNITFVLDGQKCNATTWCEIRTLELGCRQNGADQWELHIAVNILCTTPAGLNPLVPGNYYAIEELLGLVTSFFTGITSELGCLSLESIGGQDLHVDRPRQIDPSTNIRKASVTGYYCLRINT